MATQRFEFSKGSSRKFWEIDVKRSVFTVHYGRIGTDGQTRTKDFASSVAAKSAAEKLIASKVKKGYVPTQKGSKSAANKSAAKNAIGDAVHVVEPSWPKDSFVGLWEDGRDLWIVGCDGKKPKDVSTQDMLDSEGFVHRWRFGSTRHAKTAAKAIQAERPNKGCIPDWLEPDVASWTDFLEEKDHARIACFGVSKSGPMTLHRTSQHQWLHPRPPSSGLHCTLSATT